MSGREGLGVSVHADAAVSLKPIASTPSIVKAAEELPILETGTMVPYDDLEVYASRRLSGALRSRRQTSVPKRRR